MNLYNTTSHQKSQIDVINKIESQALSNKMQYSTVDPVEDYINDPRIALTSVHFPKDFLKKKVYEKIIEPLKQVTVNHHYYRHDSLHLTIKNIRLINNPPTFNSYDINKVKRVYEETIPKHNKFKVYFYRLLLFPANLSLIGTTDPELDLIHQDLDTKLRMIGVPDDKKYLNNRFFFANLTLVRFTSDLSKELLNKINEISSNISFDPYIIDSVSLLSCNATLNKKHIFGTWSLK